MDARQHLEEANVAISTAAMILGTQRETFEQFMRESRDMDNFGHIVDPTLWNKPERRAVEALLKPLYQAALDFLKSHDRQMAATKTALEKVRANG
jgi:hypothetical protein